jgi:hypothetical protein
VTLSDFLGTVASTRETRLERLCWD